MLTALSALMVAVGLVGIVVPVLPGLWLVWAGAALWSLAGDADGRYLVLVVATVLAVAGTVAKYLLPGRDLGRDGVPRPTLLAGAVLGVAGFFVVPVVGLPLGFVLGVFLAELERRRSRADAWRATLTAVRGVLRGIAVELTAGVLVALTWLVGVIAG